MLPKMPVLFIAHGAPMLLDDPVWVSELHAWANALPRPRAVLMISAHWESKPTTIGATSIVPLIYDFYGFAEKYYQLSYPSPGASDVAQRVRDLLRGAGLAFTDDPSRGLDHGTYVPLMCMYPEADIPVLQLSLPSLEPKALFALGQSLAPLADEGVLIAGSGFLTHNLRLFGNPQTQDWAREFDTWIADVIARHDIDKLIDYRAKAPHVAMAHPTHEHFAPVLLAAGAGGGRDVTFPITGFWYGSFTKRSVQFG